MITENIISRLNKLIGEFDTPFFNYLHYSYDLSLNDCEFAINKLKEDINNNKIFSDNLVLIIEEYFKSIINDKEKEVKIKYLDELLDFDNEFYIKFLKKYELSNDEIIIIRDKIKNKILNENISDFEIKRLLRYYFLNSTKQKSYLKDLDFIVGKNYDTLFIKNAKKKYPNLVRNDFIQIISTIKSDIIGACNFKNGIKNDFYRRCMEKSESKKAEAKIKLEKFVEGSGDSFSKLVKFKKLSKQDGEIIVSEILDDINTGLIQPEMINSIFITKRFDEYNER